MKLEPGGERCIAVKPFFSVGSALFYAQKDVRYIALWILNSLENKRRTLDFLFEIVHNKRTLSKKDRSLLQALVFGVLRWRGFLDTIIAYFSKVGIEKIELNILNILRIGLFQIIYLSKIPVSAAVHTAVEMAKSSSSQWTAGYVNALLRKASANYKKIPLPDPQKDPIGSLSIKRSFPRWLIEKWTGRMGFKETEALCEAINRIPPITICTNRLKATRKELAKELQHQAKNIRLSTYSPEGISLLGPTTSIPEMKVFKRGWFHVQDEASQLVSFLLDPQPGESVLDACSGFGGKTGHLAQRMNNSGRIVAVDKNKKKLFRLQSEMGRLGISIATTFPFDLNYPLSKDFTAMFDRILVDAPCSGLGVLRRNPDIKWNRSKKQLKIYHEKQVKFLNNVSSVLKPTGVLVYAVCSTEPEEGDDVIKAFLAEHSDFTADKTLPGVSMAVRSLVNDHGFFQTYPHRHHMDGFFSVRMKRGE
ncbi:MAG: 16S rRNA (cytosine(967)-C(5))-methyltransferase RsmB [Desulfobacterales bacterium]